MKKLLVVLSLAFAAVSFQAGAATFSLLNLSNASSDVGVGVVANSQHVGHSFSTGWKLTSDTSGPVLVAITANPAFSFDTLVKVNGFSVKTFASSTLDKVFNLSFLASDVVEFFVKGTAGRSGNIDISVSSVPVPAAVWLFGSALMGMMGVTRRKKA